MKNNPPESVSCGSRPSLKNMQNVLRPWSWIHWKVVGEREMGNTYINQGNLELVEILFHLVMIVENSLIAPILGGFIS